jgi:hypothetical protein
MTKPRHTLGRMLTIMEQAGSITPVMADAALALAGLLAQGRARTLPATLGPPAAECLFAIARGIPLRQWAQDGWQGRRLTQETASGILIGALGALAHGNARLLLDQALAAAAGAGAEARPLVLHGAGLPPPGDDCRSHRDPAALRRADTR